MLANDGAFYLLVPLSFSILLFCMGSDNVKLEIISIFLIGYVAGFYLYCLLSSFSIVLFCYTLEQAQKDVVEQVFL